MFQFIKSAVQHTRLKLHLGGTEILNNKIIRLMLSEKIKSKGTDNSDKARYNSNTLCFVGQQKGGI